MQPLSETVRVKKPWYRSSTLWIFVGLALGVVLGGSFPQDEFPEAFNFFRFLSKAFINLIKSIIIPILISTIIVGIAQTGDIKAVGRMGAKSIGYFLTVTTTCLFLGLVIANWLEPGKGLPLNLALETTTAGPRPAAPSIWDIMLRLFPSNLLEHGSHTHGVSPEAGYAGQSMGPEILQVVIFSVLFGIALTRVGEHGKPVLTFFEAVAQVMFKYTDLVMRLTPLGVFGAMAYNVSHMAAGHTMPDGSTIEGWPAVFHLLGQYARLVGSLYLALVVLFAFVFVPIMIVAGIRVTAFVKAIKEPALTAFSTASSEAALPRLLEDIVAFGVPRRVASFVIPTGYSFNLDGSTLYLVLASLTIAQAAGIDMSIGDQLLMLVTFMLTSKGVAGVPRATLVIISATCASFGLPGEAGVAMLLAVDEVMDMARTMINVTGNGLAAVVIAKWEGVFGARPDEAVNLGVDVPSAEEATVGPD